MFDFVKGKGGKQPTDKKGKHDKDGDKDKKPDASPTTPEKKVSLLWGIKELNDSNLSAGLEIVKKTAAFIEENGGFEEEGIFRKAGDEKALVRLKKLTEEEANYKFSKEEDIHTIATLLKRYLREMKDPLLTFKHYCDFIAADDNEDADARFKDVVAALTLIPKANYELLKELMLFLHKLSLHSEVTKMHSPNLAIVFAPNILKPEVETPFTLLSDSNHASNMINSLIKDYNEIFSDKIAAPVVNKADFKNTLREKYASHTLRGRETLAKLQAEAQLSDDDMKQHLSKVVTKIKLERSGLESLFNDGQGGAGGPAPIGGEQVRGNARKLSRSTASVEKTLLTNNQGNVPLSNSSTGRSEGERPVRQARPKDIKKVAKPLQLASDISVEEPTSPLLKSGRRHKKDDVRALKKDKGQLSDLFISVADINFGAEPDPPQLSPKDAEKSGDTLSAGEKTKSEETSPRKTGLPSPKSAGDPSVATATTGTTNAATTATTGTTGTTSQPGSTGVSPRVDGLQTNQRARALARGSPMLNASSSDPNDLKRQGSLRFFHSALVNSFGLDSISIESDKPKDSLIRSSDPPTVSTPTATTETKDAEPTSVTASTASSVEPTTESTATEPEKTAEEKTDQSTQALDAGESGASKESDATNQSVVQEQDGTKADEQAKTAGEEKPAVEQPRGENAPTENGARTEPGVARVGTEGEGAETPQDPADESEHVDLETSEETDDDFTDSEESDDGIAQDLYEIADQVKEIMLHL